VKVEGCGIEKYCGVSRVEVVVVVVMGAEAVVKERGCSGYKSEGGREEEVADREVMEEMVEGEEDRVVIDTAGAGVVAEAEAEAEAVVGGAGVVGNACDALGVDEVSADDRGSSDREEVSSWVVCEGSESK
jgi:hypothetical protein